MFIFEKTTWKWSLIWMKFRLMNNSSMILPSTKNEAVSNLLTCCFSIISIFFFVCLFLWNCFECGYEFLQDCRVNNGEQNAKNRKILSAIVSKRQASKCQVVIFYGTGFINYRILPNKRPGRFSNWKTTLTFLPPNKRPLLVSVRTLLGQKHLFV